MTNRQTTQGTSLAKGPAGLVGLALLAYGISALIFAGHSFVQHAPNGAVHGESWLSLEVNGWSGLLFIAAGLLLLLAAPLHWAAKGMSLIVGLALGTTAAIALANGHGTLGIFAANHLTELVWGAAAAVLIVVSQLPRVGGKTKTRKGDVQRLPTRHQVKSEPRAAERAQAEPTPRSAQPPAAHESAVPVEREPVAANGALREARVASARATSLGPAAYRVAALLRELGSASGHQQHQRKTNNEEQSA
ncbi:MAG: hypothetical protein ACLP0J_15235 [Solirubrobacteraceae bacterium]